MEKLLNEVFRFGDGTELGSYELNHKVRSIISTPRDLADVEDGEVAQGLKKAIAENRVRELSNLSFYQGQGDLKIKHCAQ